MDNDGDDEDTDFKYFKLSQWLLYSMGVLGDKLRIRLRVSLTVMAHQKGILALSISITYTRHLKTIQLTFIRAVCICGTSIPHRQQVLLEFKVRRK